MCEAALTHSPPRLLWEAGVSPWNMLCGRGATLHPCFEPVPPLGRMN